MPGLYTSAGWRYLRNASRWVLGLLMLARWPAYAQPADTLARSAPVAAQLGLLTTGWRYHAGDDPTWAQPTLDDSHWDTIKVAVVGRPLPARALAGTGWFRLHLHLADSLQSQALMLGLPRSLASFEVYANGRRLGSYGSFSRDPARVQPGGPRINPLPLVVVDARAEIVLAVRFTPWYPGGLLGALLVDNPGRDMSLRLLLRPAQPDQSYQQNIIFCGSLAGLFLVLGLLHFVFFRYNPTQRANAYFAVYALASAGMYGDAFVDFSTLSLLAYASLNVLEIAGLGLALLAVLRALYVLFELRPPRWLFPVLYGATACLTLLAAYRLLVNSTTYYSEFQAIVALLTLALLRVTWLGVRQRRRGSQLIGLGFGLGLLLAVVNPALLFLYLHFPNAVPLDSPLLDLVALACHYLSLLVPPLSISLYLAIEFALAAQQLQLKLREVEQLSAQTLAQEQEKQVLLAQQNETLEQQVQRRTGELQRSLTELRQTQAQLLQKEKMASLGELTAGIAHEIQNPLNFVNNFADVSAELMLELVEAQAAGDGAEVRALATDVRQNLTKITEHGQRAAGIVHGMLEHSRTRTGERAPTDVNALCAEYLRLAYHGLRAKDKSFHAELQTDFAPDLPLVEGVGTDLGRVLLNLCNNAFYAVQQRQRTGGEAGYVPLVCVRTRQLGSQVEIQVQDNGPGMSAAVQAKVFQPFFTTKPTGEGTGLGLSLSYDIVTQGHGGTLTVASELGQGSLFRVMLPK